MRHCAVLVVFWIERNNTISEDKNEMDFLWGWSIFGISLCASLSKFFRNSPFSLIYLYWGYIGLIVLFVQFIIDLFGLKRVLFLFCL